MFRKVSIIPLMFFDKLPNDIFGIIINNFLNYSDLIIFRVCSKELNERIIKLNRHKKLWTIYHAIINDNLFCLKNYTNIDNVLIYLGDLDREKLIKIKMTFILYQNVSIENRRKHQDYVEAMFDYYHHFSEELKFLLSLFCICLENDSINCCKFIHEKIKKIKNKDKKSLNTLYKICMCSPEYPLKINKYPKQILDYFVNICTKKQRGITINQYQTFNNLFHCIDSNHIQNIEHIISIFDYFFDNLFFNFNMNNSNNPELIIHTILINNINYNALEIYCKGELKSKHYKLINEVINSKYFKDKKSFFRR